MGKVQKAALREKLVVERSVNGAAPAPRARQHCVCAASRVAQAHAHAAS